MRVPFIPNTVILLFGVLAAVYLLALRSGYVVPAYSPLPRIDLATQGGWFVDWRLAGLAQDRELCAKVMTPPHAAVSLLAPQSPDARGCGWLNAVSLEEAEGVRLGVSPVSCQVAAALTLWLRDVAQQVRVVVLEGGKAPVILVSTDPSLSALQIIEIYGARVSIELTIRDLKQHVGLGDSQCTTTLAILRFVHLACLAFCVWRLALLEHREAGWLQGTASRVSLPEAPLSFQRVRRALRAWATRQVLFATSAPGADWEQIERDHEPLLQRLR